MNILPLSLVVLELIYAIFTTSPSALLRIGAMSIKNQAVFCQQIGAIQLTSSFVARNYLVQFRIRWEQIPKSRVWEELCHYYKVSLD